MRIEAQSGQRLLASLAVCPVCDADLDGLAGRHASCAGCGRTYRATDGVFDFVPEPPPDRDVAEPWALWEHLEENGRVSYENDPHHNLSVGVREDCDAFAAFADLDGTVLDVGCGPQRLPTYARDFSGVLVGVDPLVGELPRAFVFVRAIGEYLPFRSDAFDRVLFATSLDHTLSPARALAEARRVVKPTGSVVLWVGEKADHPHRHVRESHEWYDRLSVPEGAADRFHAVRFDRALARRYLKDAALDIVDVENDGRRNVFIRARKP